MKNSGAFCYGSATKAFRIEEINKQLTMGNGQFYKAGQIVIFGRVIDHMTNKFSDLFIFFESLE
jgi:hypothetical protein